MSLELLGHTSSELPFAHVVLFKLVSPEAAQLCIHFRLTSRVDMHLLEGPGKGHYVVMKASW